MSWPAAIEQLASPAGPNSGQPQLSSSGRGLLLSWIERDGQKATLRFAERTVGGWSAPRDVASGTDWFVNWADVPSALRLASGELVAHWLQKSGPDTYAYDVRVSYSKDDGKTWSASFTPHSDGTKTEHGFASLVQMPGAGLGLAWLDGRAMKSGGSHDAHGADAGAMSVRFATFGKDWKQTSEMPVDLRVCECCPTTAAVTSEGPIVAYRNRTEDEVRDIFISRLENGKWTEPKAVRADAWKIAACPVNGPMLSARGRDVAIAWFTAQGDQPRAFVAFSKDAGRTFGSPIRLDDAGSLGRVDVELMADGSAWSSSRNRGVSVRPVGIDVPTFTTGYHWRNGRSLYQPTTEVSPSPLNVSLNATGPVGRGIVADRVTSGTLAAACNPKRSVTRTSRVRSGTVIRVRSCIGLSTSDEPSYAVSRSSAPSHAPTLNRLPLTPSVSTPRQPGRYGFAQPLHVIWADAGLGINHALPASANAQIARLNIRPLPGAVATA